MPENYPHPRSRPVSLHRASQWILRGSGTAIRKTVGSARPFLPVVVLIIASALCSCRAEQPPPRGGPQAQRLERWARLTDELVTTAARTDCVLFPTGPMTTGNTAPSIREIYVEPLPLQRGELIKLRVAASDPVGDPVSLPYKWCRNN